MQHIVLLGDSILDNEAYLEEWEPDVIKQLRRKLPDGWKATRLANDGDMTYDIKGQLKDMPRDATFLVLSVGGNDALHNQDILCESERSHRQFLLDLADIQEEFQYSYRSMLQNVLKTGLPTAVCTIYYPRFPEQNLQRMAKAGLSLFNDCIIQEALANGLPLIDLRTVCNENKDYANPIEPSAHGGEKITDAILKVVKEYHYARYY